MDDLSVFDGFGAVDSAWFSEYGFFCCSDFLWVLWGFLLDIFGILYLCESLWVVSDLVRLWWYSENALGFNGTEVVRLMSGAVELETRLFLLGFDLITEAGALMSGAGAYFTLALLVCPLLFCLAALG